MSDNNHQDGRKGPGEQPSGQPNPLEGFVAASALGMAMAGQAMQFWFGVVSGVARAGQDSLDKDRTAKAAKADVSSSARSVDVTPKAAEAKVVQPKPRAEPEAVKPAAPVEALAVAPVAEAAQKPAAPKAQAKPAAKVEKLAEKVEEPTAAAEPAAPVVPVEAPVAKVVEAAKKPASPKAQAKPVDKLKAVEKPAAKVEKPAAKVEEPAPTVAAIAVAPVASEKPVASIAPDDFRQPKAIDKPETPDDLKQIAGVGPKVEKVLNGLGVWTYAQVAAWKPEETAWVDDYLGLNGRILRDGWAGQAQALAAKAVG